jgi:hypothetical protein
MLQRVIRERFDRIHEFIELLVSPVPGARLGQPFDNIRQIMRDRP